MIPSITGIAIQNLRLNSSGGASARRQLHGGPKPRGFTPTPICTHALRSIQASGMAQPRRFAKILPNSSRSACAKPTVLQNRQKDSVDTVGVAPPNRPPIK